MIRSTMRGHPAKRQHLKYNTVKLKIFCKMYLAKIKKFVFFLITIRIITQKCYIFAKNLQNQCLTIKTTKTMPNKFEDVKTQMIFKQVNGQFVRVDSRDANPFTLAYYLNTLNIVVDDDTQFCRIKRYFGNMCQTIIYRAYNNAKIQINIHTYKVLEYGKVLNNLYRYQTR